MNANDDAPRGRYKYKYRYKYLQQGEGTSHEEHAEDADALRDARREERDSQRRGNDEPGYAGAKGVAGREGRGDGARDSGEDRDEDASSNSKTKNESKDDDGKKNQDDKDDPKKRRRKRWIFGGIALVFVIAGLIWLLLYLFVFSKREKTDDAYVGGDQVAIAPKIAGTVVEVLVDDTERVRAGQVLVRLDPADAAATLIQAEGALAQAVRQAQQLSHSADQADAAIAARQADVARASDDYTRKRPLLAEHAIAPEEVSAALQQLNAAKAALEQTQRQAKAAHALVDEVDVQHNPAVLQARAQYVTAWINNGRGALIAPIDGYAAQRDVQVGQQVQPGQRLLVIVPLDRLWVDANFKEAQLRNIRIGQPVELESDLYGSDVTFHGRVSGLAAGTGGAFSLLPPQNASGNWIKIVQRLPVRIVLDPKELAAHPLRLGLSTTATVDTHERGGAVLADEPRRAALMTTDVYREELDRAGAEADAVIQRNLLGIGPAATGKR